MKQRILSVLLALTMLLSMLPAAVFAAEGETEEDVIWVTHEGIGSIEDSFPLPDTFGLTSGLTYDGSYYKQLDPNSKAVYDAIYADSSPLKAGPAKYVKDDPQTYVSFNILCTSTDDAQDIISAALAALLYDHPELSWLVNTQWSYGYTTTNESMTAITSFKLSDQGYTEATTPYTEGNYGHADTKDRAAITAAITSAKSDIGSLSNATEYEKIKAIHDWVCNNMKYTDQSSPKFTNNWRGFQTAYSALVEGDTVCAGYSKSFKLLCDEYGIPCATVSGTGGGGPHAWNYVQCEGNWYGVDCTWDDMDSGVRYDYFLKGYAAFTKNGTDHNEGSLYGAYAFAYPALYRGGDYKDPSAPDTIDLTYDSSAEKTSSSGTKYFDVPIITELGKTATTEIKFTAIPIKNGSAMSDKEVEWGLSVGADGVSLTPNSDGTATLVISSSTNNDYDPNDGYIGGYSVTVDAMCGGETTKQRISIWGEHKTAAFVQIPEGNKTLATGGTATYTAKVYDQYGIEITADRQVTNGSKNSDGSLIYHNMTVPTVNWAVAPAATGITVNNGTVTVAANATAGDYTVTATVGTGASAPSASVTITVPQAGHTHSWSTEWTCNNTHHWHNCTASTCPVTDNSKKDGYAAHETDEGKTTKEPTCTETGVKTFSCKVCGQVIKTEVLPVIEHKWDAGQTTKAPTCTAPGVKTFTCSVCKTTKTEELSKTEHTWSKEWQKDNTDHWHACTNSSCTATSEKIPHTWNEGVETTPPTYAAPGVKIFTCTACGQTKTEAIDQLEHKYSTTWSRDETYHWHACIDTGFESLRKDEAPHTWTKNDEKSTAATTEADGKNVYDCTCGAEKEEIIGAIGHNYSEEWTTSETEHWKACTDADCTAVTQKTTHNWDAGTVKTAATHTDSGVMTYTCTVCSKSKEEEIPAHTVSPLWSGDADKHWHACTESTCTVKDSEGDHEWDEGTVTTPATFDAPGVKTITCAVCSQKKTETIPQKTHTYSSAWSTDAEYHWHACTDAGYESLAQDKALHVYDSAEDMTCDTCGYTRTAEPPSHTHTWAAAWSSNSTHHWHDCTASGCDVTANSGKSGYAAHTPGDWITDKAATSATAGSRHKECTVCGYKTQTESIPATGGNSSGGGGGGGSSSSDSSGTTTRNPDGSTTTTTTRSDGTTVETTNRKDGTKEVVETKKDGTVITTETAKNGDKTVTTEHKDGSVQEAVTKKDGSSATVTTSPSGDVEAAVTVKPAGGTATAPFSPVRVGSSEVLVTVKTGSSGTTKVQVPVSNISSGVVAVLVKADGTEEVIKTSVPTANGLLVPVKDGETVKLENRAKSFRDMGSTAWAQSAVDFVSAREMFAGTAEDTFSPDVDLTRAQMVTVLARYQGVDTNGGSTWYEKGVQWAMATGVSDGTNPDGQISREQMVAMLWRVAGRPEVKDSAKFQSFRDAGSVAGYAREAMAWAIENGIVSGVDASTISPQGTATRAQVAAVLARYVQNIDAQK